MENFLTTLGYGLLALLGVATLVAFWKQWRSRQISFATQPASPDLAPGPRRVDVDLSTLAPAAPAGDQVERRHTVDGALLRMARAPSDDPAWWTETRPMVAPGEATHSETH